jgi:uncharacterized protein (TIGR03437 family)
MHTSGTFEILLWKHACNVFAYMYFRRATVFSNCPDSVSRCQGGPIMMRLLAGFFAFAAAALSQQPVITAGGVVSAASYTQGIAGLTTAGYPQTGGGPALVGGSIASIFGSGLAASAQSAGTLPLPITLGGTSVSVNGIAAPLFFVSPTQINFQIPSGTDTTPGASNAAGVVVSTGAGQSSPYQLTTGVDSTPSIFTQNSSGCGQAAVLNIASNGGVSLNSPSNSAVPGNFISIYGTGNGLVTNSPADGSPAPSSPLAKASIAGGPVFDFSAAGGGAQFWAGRAPGLVGVDQFNFIVPSTVRQGCAVPLQIMNGNLSVPVTVSIAANGGACVDPQTQGYGEILWEKTVTTGAPVTTSNGVTQSVTEADAVTVSLQASPGRQAPTVPVFTEGGTLPQAYTYFGPACPVPGYRSLAAGTVTASGPGLAPVPAPAAPLPARTVFNVSIPENGFTQVSQVQSGQVAGLTEYTAALSPGTIQAGSFTIASSGGADVGAFQSSVQIGSPIKVTTALAGVTLNCCTNAPSPFTITWTGGDSNSWVTLEMLGHYGPYDHYPLKWVARASDGQITIQGAGLGFAIAGPVDIVMEVVPDPSTVPTFSTTGLSLGGRAFWKYTYIFQGVLVEP